MGRSKQVNLSILLLKICVVVVISISVISHTFDFMNYVKAHYNSDKETILVMVWFICRLLCSLITIMVICYEDTVSLILFIILNVVVIVINVMYYQQYICSTSNIMEFVELMVTIFFEIVVCIVDAYC